MSVHMASVIVNNRPSWPANLELKVYKTQNEFDSPWRYYWCCEADGACSKRHTTIEAAITEGALHVTEFHREDSHADSH